MGNNPTKSSDKKTNKNKKLFCCLSTSSFSIDEKYLPAFDPILSTNNQETSSQKRTYCCQSIEDLGEPLHSTDSIARILTRKSNRDILNLTNKFQLNCYLKDYQNRLKSSQIQQTFKTHFLSSTIIYPCNGINQLLTDDLNIFITSPPESILPSLLTNTNSSYKIHEQIRSKCYFIPLTNCEIEPDDEEFKQKSIQLDRTHVVITLEKTATIKTNQISIEFEPTCIFTSEDSFQTGFIYLNQEKIAKEFVPFMHHCSEDNLSYLSSNLIQQWFNTLVLVNQTCAIVKRFLVGDGSQITCLLREQMENLLDKENSSPFHNNFIFAALRLPPCTYLHDPSSSNSQEERSAKLIDAFSPKFLSDNRKISNDTIHIDYEQYSFAFVLSRWPKTIIEDYYKHPNRYSKRQWPSNHQMNILMRKSLLLVPDFNRSDKWKINFDLIEQSLFELMNESTLFFYILCQQLFSQAYPIRILIKHCFLNYCEKHGAPFSNNQNNILHLINHFLKELSEQIKQNFIPNYFNHQINLLNSNENYNQWFNYINKCVHDRSYFFSSSSITISNRSIIVEFLFHFINQLYQTFQIKQSQFYLNDNILVDLHKQLCEKLSNDTNNNQNIFLQHFMNDLLNNKQTIEAIQMNLIGDFDINAELVHTCLNQIRKAHSSLIFHYTWTIFIQYLHTYYNVLWNVE